MKYLILILKCKIFIIFININIFIVLNKKELNIELGLKQDRSFERGELIFDYNKLEALANLNHSLVRQYY